ncbi:response regulator transcription factor [Streptomyces avermitilis]|uniref:response regulator transcription factor n=1 Tax=Streptomyces avermitilis TaxID=33903 RepID=UPI0033A4A1B2
MSTSSPPIRVVVADDHLVVRTGFSALLDSQPDFTVVRTVSTGAEAVRVCREVSPDVVLMDIRMPEMDGIEATRQLVGSPFPSASPASAASLPSGSSPASAASLPSGSSLSCGSSSSPASGGPRVLILTTFDLDEYVYDALRAGASGFLLKEATAERLFEAVRVVAAGDALLAPGITRRLIGEFARLPARAGTAPPPGLKTLTARETEVLLLVAEGLSNPEIAARLGVGEETVKTHVSRILTKLALRDRTQAVIAAYETGLVVPGFRGPG